MTLPHCRVTSPADLAGIGYPGREQTTVLVVLREPDGIWLYYTAFYSFDDGHTEHSHRRYRLRREP